MGRKDKLSKNTIILSFGTFFPALVSYITLPIITGTLTKEEYGTYSLISTVIALLIPVATLQIQSAAFRFLIDVRHNQKEITKIITTIVVFIVINNIGLSSISFILLYSLSFRLRLYISLLLLIQIIFQVELSIFRGLGKNKLYSISIIVQSIINMVMISICIIGLKQGLEGLLFAGIISLFLSGCIILYKSRCYIYFKLRYFSKSLLGSMLSYSWPMIPNSLSIWILGLSDRVIISAVLGVELTAIYVVANIIPGIIQKLISPFYNAWLENASTVVSEEDAGYYYGLVFDKVVSLLCGLVAVVIAVTPLLFPLLVRGNYEDAYAQMPILFLSVLFASLSSLLGGIYVAHKKTKSVGLTTIAAALVNIIVHFVLIWNIGIYAASISTLVSYFFWFIFRIFDIQNFQKIYFNWRKLILYICIISIMGGISYIHSNITYIINSTLGCTFALFVNRKLVMSIFLNILSLFHEKNK